MTFYTDEIPEDRRNTTDNWFNNYMIGLGGLCSVYDPPVSYWCSEHPSGGGAFAFRTPQVRWLVRWFVQWFVRWFLRS